MKKSICLLLLTCSLTTFSFEAGYSITNTNSVIFNYNENEVKPIASLTKVMNVLVALDEIKKGNVHLNDIVNINKNVTLINETGIEIKVGDKITLEDLLKAELVYSANNAAYAVAYYISNNNLDQYIKLMNNKAKELKMNSTLFYTPAGLPTRYTQKPLDVSTAKDLSKMAIEALKYEKLIKWSGLKSIMINGKEYKNRNKLLGKNGNFGLKTGFHNLSGFNMIGINDIKGNILINITLDDKTNKEKFLSQENLSNNFEKNLNEILKKDQYYGKIEVKNSKEKFISSKLNSNFYYFNSDFKINEKVYNLNGNVKIGDKVGEINICTLDNKIIKSIDIISTSKARKLNFFERILKFFNLI